MDTACFVELSGTDLSAFAFEGFLFILDLVEFCEKFFYA